MINNFGDLEEKFSAYPNSRVVILPLAYEGTVTYGKGTSFGPAAIITASSQLELYDEELGQETYRIGIHTHPGINGKQLSPEAMIEATCQEATHLLREEKFPVALGGEHSLTLGLVQAMASHYPDLSVLQLDAHADLRDIYQDSKYNHACIGRRLLELASLTQVGIRSLDREQQAFIEENKENLKVFYAYQMAGKTSWMKEAITKLSPHVYLTLDLDVLDPGVMPAVGTPEPGGLGWYELLSFLRLLTEKKEVVGFDLVELAPQAGNTAPDFLAAKLTYKLLGYIFRDKSLR